MHTTTPINVLKHLAIALIVIIGTATAQAAETVFYFHNDHLGTPQVITDENQTVVWQADYDPFGKATVTVNTVENNLRFPGQYYDSESGLHYNYFREYDPSTGRYLQSDPLGLYDGPNTYTYVYGNPLSYTDPTGEFGVVGAGIGAVIDLGLQLAQNGGNLRCVSWGQVAASAALGAVGAVGGGLTTGALTGVFKHSVKGLPWLKSSHNWGAVSQRVRRAQNVPGGNQLHHWAISRNGAIGKHVPNSIKNHPWNLNSIPRNVHTRIHGQNRVQNLPRYNAGQRWWYGTPNWAKAGQVAGGSAGGIAGNNSGGNQCGC